MRHNNQARRKKNFGLKCIRKRRATEIDLKMPEAGMCKCQAYWLAVIFALFHAFFLLDAIIVLSICFR